jgi:uncharacterized protein YwgA
MPNKIESLKDLLMILLYARGHTGEQCQPIQGRTRLMKMVFIFKKELLDKINKDKTISDEAIPEFDAYDYGPFSAQVYSDLEFLIDMGFVEFRDIGSESAYPEESQEFKHWTEDDLSQTNYQEFFLSSLGKNFVKDVLLSSFTDDQMRLIGEFKSRCTGTTLRALLRYVYTKYAAYTTESKIKDEILKEYSY